MSQEPAKTSSKTSSKSARIEASPGGAVDINAASRDALIALPHIGEARADAIIKGRPFKSLDELKDRKVLPASVIEALKGHISVG
jgi:DNA uptake protein ComE-like DNA-binding protein